MLNNLCSFLRAAFTLGLWLWRIDRLASPRLILVDLAVQLVQLSPQIFNLHLAFFYQLVKGLDLLRSGELFLI